MKKVILLTTILILVVLLSGCTMPEQKFEYYDTGDDNGASIAGVLPIAQTFTVGNTGSNKSFKVSYVKIKIENEQSSDRDIHVYITETDASNLPVVGYTTNYLDKTTIQYSDLSNGWNTITMNRLAFLSYNITYALILEGNASPTPKWRMDLTSPTYTGGSYCNFALGSWSASTSIDFMFEIWGIPGYKHFHGVING